MKRKGERTRTDKMRKRRNRRRRRKRRGRRGGWKREWKRRMKRLREAGRGGDLRRCPRINQCIYGMYMCVPPAHSSVVAITPSLRIRTIRIL